MKLAKKLCLLTILLLTAACSGNSYDSNKCDSYIHKYSSDYNSKFTYDKEAYNESLRSISPDEFTDIIKQLKAIMSNYKRQVEKINKMGTLTEQMDAMGRLNDTVMLSQFNSLFNLVNDASAQALVVEDNLKELQGLADIMNEAGEITNNIYSRRH